MARDFSASEYVEHTAALLGNGNVWTMSCWFKTNNAGLAQVLLSVSDKSATQTSLISLSVLATGRCEAACVDASATGSSSAAVSASTWYHALCLSQSTTHVELYLDGEAQGADTTTVDMTGLAMDTSTIAGIATVNLSGLGPFDGVLADPAIWDVDLNDDEIAYLAAGGHPLGVRRGNLVSHVPLRGDSPEFDSVPQASGWTVSGTPAVIAGPAVALRLPPSVFLEVVAAADPTATGNVAVPVFTIAGVGSVGAKTSTGGVNVPVFGIAGVGSVGAKTSTGGVSVPVFTVAGVGAVGAKTSTGGVAVPVFTVAGVGAVGAKTATGGVTIPVFTIAGVGSVGDAKTATGGVTVPVFTIAGVGVLTGARTATGGVAVPVFTIAGVGTVGGSLTGTGGVVLSVFTIAGIGVVNTPCTEKDWAVNLNLDSNYIYEARRAVDSLTSNTTLGVRHDLVYVDASGGVVTITLPAVATYTGKSYDIKKTDSSANAVTVDGDGAETIDGSTTKVLASQYDSVTVSCDGTEWRIR